MLSEFTTNVKLPKTSLYLAFFPYSNALQAYRIIRPSSLFSLILSFIFLDDSQIEKRVLDMTHPEIRIGKILPFQKRWIETQFEKGV
jgi:hypothetical protein